MIDVRIRLLLLLACNETASVDFKLMQARVTTIILSGAWPPEILDLVA